MCLYTINWQRNIYIFPPIRGQRSREIKFEHVYIFFFLFHFFLPENWSWLSRSDAQASERERERKRDRAMMMMSFVCKFFCLKFKKKFQRNRPHENWSPSLLLMLRNLVLAFSRAKHFTKVAFCIYFNKENQKLRFDRCVWFRSCVNSPYWANSNAIFEITSL